MIYKIQKRCSVFIWDQQIKAESLELDVRKINWRTLISSLIKWKQLNDL